MGLLELCSGKTGVIAVMMDSYIRSVIYHPQDSRNLAGKQLLPGQVVFSLRAGGTDPLSPIQITPAGPISSR
jgi:hypothetical protein